MKAFVIAALLIVVSIVVVALALRRGGRRRAGVEPGMVRRAFHFAGGPFPLSVALHLAGLLFLVITVHETRGRDLVMVNIEAGGGGGSGSEPDNLDVPDPPMPETSPQMEAAPSDTVDVDAIASLSQGIVRSPNGIGTGCCGGIGPGHGPGIGPGFGGFPGYVDQLRRKGLDVVLVIDGTDSMRMVMDDVKARMTQIVRAIHRLVPVARVGIVVYGGEGEPIDIQPLTLSSTKLETFLNGIRTKGGGEWEENLAGAVQAAVKEMDWKPYAHKVIVIVGDAPPKADEFASLVETIRQFHAQNGVVNAIDVTAPEHERFERAFWLKVHRELPPGTVSAMPAFYQQTRSYLALAHAGGGSMKSLEGDDRINQQVLMLAFGDKWAEEAARFGHLDDTATK